MKQPQPGCSPTNPHVARAPETFARASSKDPLAPLREFLARGQWAELAAWQGFEPLDAPIDPELAPLWGLTCEVLAQGAQARVLAASEGLRLVLVEGPVAYAEARRSMLALARQNPEECVLWWWAGAGELTAAMVEEAPGGRLFVRRLSLDRQHPDLVGLRQWSQLGPKGMCVPRGRDGAQNMRQHLSQTLRQDGLTREFFRAFSQCLYRLRSDMEGGPSELSQRHDLSLATLLRVVFLYFLQLKGGLDGDRRFVLRSFRHAVDEGKSFYRTVLVPLFFGCLNCPHEERSEQARALGAFPFLNGGLFEPLPLEQASPALDWPNEVWGQVLEEVLERYHFTVSLEDTRDESRSIDPEMLGKVFEGLMQESARLASGSFYTPRSVVRAMVEEGLVAYLQDATDVGQEAARWAVGAGEGPIPPGAQCRAMGEALGRVRVLDPAVGTGAFLMEALEVLLASEKRLGHVPEGGDGAARLRHLVHAHLYGVDVQATAVRLCELRLWLRILSAMPAGVIQQVEPLPNLSHRIATGNSLVSPWDLVTLNVSRRGEGVVSWAPGLAREACASYLERIGRLQARYLTAHGTPKVRVRAELDQIQRQMHRELLQARLHRLAEHAEPLETLARSRDLFGEPARLEPAARAELRRLAKEREALQSHLDRMQGAKDEPLAFSFETRFAPMWEQQGFDLVVTNPPWVRAHEVDRATRELLQRRYRSHDTHLWPGAQALGIEASYGTQADMAALFVERSLELLRPGGRLVALVPVKLFRSLYGTATRELLMEHELVAIEDFSESRAAMFDATTYPARLHVRKRTTPDGQACTGARRLADHAPQVSLSVWQGTRRQEFHVKQRDLWSLGEYPGEPWMLVEPEVRAIFANMRAHSRPLGTLDGLTPRKGLLTGCNEAFVLSPEQARGLLGETWAEWTRPVLCGRDVRAGAVEGTKLVLWPYDDQLRLRRQLPKALVRHFEAYAQRLETRADADPAEPLWQMFRVCEALTCPKVVWRDMGPQLEAAAVPAGVVALNTVYYMGCAREEAARGLAALLNSEPVRAMAWAIGERARGGWRRHFSWVMRLLPVPLSLAEELQATPTPTDTILGQLAALSELADTAGTRPSALDRHVGELMGLSHQEVARLRTWRSGQAACGQGTGEDGALESCA